jgi:hypothetical protein
VRGIGAALRARGTRPAGRSNTYWTKNGPVEIAASSAAERANLEAGSRVYDPSFQYASPDAFRQDVQQNAGGRTPLPMFGPEGPPGGMAKLGYQMQGPMGNALPGQGPVQWAPPRADFQSAQANALRARNS